MEGQAPFSDEHRVDIPAGAVPTYSDFVRHLWSYESPEGFSIGAPPTVYEAVFEREDADGIVVRRIAEVMGLSWEEISCSDPRPDGSWDLQFASIAALHAFVVKLARMSYWGTDDHEAARRVAEFLMWTLGYRWV